MRADNSLVEKRVYEFGNFRLDTLERVIESAGRPLSIAPKALEVLIVLVENRGRIVEKEDLMRRVWPETFVEENNLAFNIFVLRKLFGESGASPHYIETIPKRGYRFIGKVVEIPEVVLPEPLNERGNPPPPVHAISRFARLPAIVSGILILAVVGILAYPLLHRTPTLTDKDTIVLAEFSNRTGDPVFDGTLRQGLAVQLQQSPFLSVISEERIQQVLPLMGQRADARITPELAREICERTASAAVLEGSIASLGRQYVLGLRAKNCRTGNILEEEQAQATRKEDVLNSLSQIAIKFRTRAGESLATIEKHSAPLAEATTPSLDALKAYSEALMVHSSTGGAAGLPLFERAIAIDPNFAMAYAFLGHLYGELGESDLSAENTRKAWQLRNRASDAEKFFITASYELRMLGNIEKAQQTCEAWGQAYPRERDAHGFMAGIIYPVTAKYKRAVEEAKKALALDPDSPLMYAILAGAYISLDRLADAEGVFKQASERKLGIPEFLQMRHNIAFLKADEAGMEREAALSQAKPGVEDGISGQEALVLAYTGRLQKARARSRRAVDLAQQTAHGERAALYETGAALWEAFSGNAPGARRNALAALALSNDREVEYGAAFALALLGDSSQAQSLAEDLERRFPEDTSVRFSYLPALRGRLALNHGGLAKAIELLQAAAPYELGTPRSAFHGFFGALYPVYVRGEARLAAHQGIEAAADFQKILDHRGVVLSDPIGAVARLQLGRAFVLSGDRMRAKAAYQDFLTLWKDADPGIPILKQAKAEYAKLR
jgi:DNA-binding winged helix-turn-helix (wHTH) protein